MKTFFLLHSHVLYSLILLCPCTLIVCVCMHVCGKRERQSASRERRTGEDEVRGKQARARKRVKGTGQHKDGENERKKNALQSNGRLFDALPLVVVRVLVGDGDDVLFPSSFLALHFSLALFCVVCNIWFVQPHSVAYSSYYYPIFFRCSSFFFSLKRPTTATHNATTTYFLSSSSSSSEVCEHTARPSKTCRVCMCRCALYAMRIYICFSYYF
jgi:hypothetical protein